ncbi:hypothetical protein ACFQ0M_49720 [Kitasatospora aburaviensis]
MRVVALDGRGRIALVEENVYVCGQRLLMCPGGGCEPGEDPVAAARGNWPRRPASAPPRSSC